MGSVRRLTMLERFSPPELPTLDELIPPDARRPGELHDVLPLPDVIARRLASAAAAGGLTPAVGASIVLEAGLVIADLEAADITGPVPRLNRACSEELRPRALTAAEANYIRALTIGRHRRGLGASEISAPVRLIARVGASDLDRVSRIVPVESAVRWECRAVREGRTLTEWALVTCLRS